MVDFVIDMDKNVIFCDPYLSCKHLGIIVDNKY